MRFFVYLKWFLVRGSFPKSLNNKKVSTKNVQTFQSFSENFYSSNKEKRKKIEIVLKCLEMGHQTKGY